MIQKAAYLVLVLASLLVLGSASPSLEIYVSPDGNDKAAGSLKAPLRSLQAAAELGRKNAGQIPVTIFLSGGRHEITTPLKLGPEHGGTPSKPVKWKALPGERPIISGGIPVNTWKKEADGSWSASLPDSFQGTFRSFYMNGIRAIRARYPDNTYLRVKQAGKDNRTNFYFNKNELPEIDTTEDLELILLHDWSVTRIPVQSIDWNSRQLTAIDSIGARLPFFTLSHWEKHPRYFLENAREFCDQPGEWYADFTQRKIYYHPLPGETIKESSGIIPLAEKLVLIEGREENPVSHISFEGISFEHSSWQLPEKGYCGVQACMYTDRTKSSSGWSKIPAAIELDMARHCSFKKCTIRNTGGTGIWIRRNCLECEISDSHIHHVSGNGISIGEGNDRIVDGNPWWKAHPEEVSQGNEVSHTLIEHCGLEFHGAVGIWCGLVANTRIEHNEIRDLPYTGISVGWMWTPEPTPCRENTLHANHIHHILNILSDGGGIYSLGLQPDSRITRNLIHDVKVNAGRAESNGMFLDEGTKELLIEDNIIYNIARSPLRFHKAASPNLVQNNVLVCNKDIAPIAYNNTPESNIRKTGNTILNQDSDTDMLRLEEQVKEFLEKSIR